MNCQEARLHIGAEPGNVPPALADHLAGCPACRRFLDEMTALDGRIRRALEIEPPKLAARPARLPRHLPRRWAMAASLLVALAVGALVWTARPADTLAAEIVAHVEGEPASWMQRTPLPQSALDFIARRSGIEIDASAGAVVYARNCPFRGQSVPHLVVTTSRGPVTVLVLRNERVESQVRFKDNGYEGMLLPTSAGALAVLGRGATDLDAAAREIQAIVR